MWDVRGDTYALGDGVTRREHQVVAVEIKAADRPGIQREELPVVSMGEGQAVEGARVDREALDCGGDPARGVEERVEIGVWIASRQVVVSGSTSMPKPGLVGTAIVPD